MRKSIISVLVAILLLTIAFTSCSSKTDTTNQGDKTDLVFDSSSTASNENDNSSSKDGLSDTETEKTNGSHYETIRTYFVYAEQGAVITWYDPQTGAFRYNDKCETCGKVGNSEHGGGLHVNEGMDYSASYCCINSNCSMWGKSQPVKISCNVTTEWIEVSD